MRATLLAAASVDVFCNLGMAFQTLVIRFVASVGYPGTGSWSLFEDTDLVVLRFGRSLKRHFPIGFIECLAFQTVTATIDATASLRHFR